MTQFSSSTKKAELAKFYDGKKITFVSGVFNVLHAGHLRLLRFAKECGDILIVGVLDDSNTSSLNHVPQEQRLKFIKSIDWVDNAFILEQSIIDCIHDLQPETVVKGKEHEFQHNEETNVIKAYGGKLLFSAGESSFTFSEIIRAKNEAEYSSINQPKNFLDQHQTDIDKLLKLIKRFSTLSVCVIGDTIVDEYIHCDPLGMSQEDPTLVVTPTKTDRFIGGGAIVASHIKTLGAKKVTYASVLGEDEIADFVHHELDILGVDALLLKDSSRPTTLKQRFRSKNKTLLRVNQLRQHHISHDLQTKLLNKLTNQFSDCDLLVFTDFNYGVLPQGLVDELCQIAKLKNIMMVADSQCSSQIGDISRFKNMHLIAPTEHEARIAIKNTEDGLVVLAEKLKKQSLANHILITLGEEGMLIHADAKTEGFVTDRLPAFNLASVDNAGAGDCLLATTAMTLAIGGNIWEGCYLGSLAAAIQVNRLGNKPLSHNDLRKILKSNN